MIYTYLCVRVDSARLDGTCEECIEILIRSVGSNHIFSNYSIMCCKG